MSKQILNKKEKNAHITILSSKMSRVLLGLVDFPAGYDLLSDLIDQLEQENKDRVGKMLGGTLPFPQDNEKFYPDQPVQD